MSTIDRMKELIRANYKCDSIHFNSKSILEEFEGKIAWKGTVEIFKLRNHPAGAKICYSWAAQEDDGRKSITTVLGTDQIDTAQKAVQGAIIAAYKNITK